MNRQNHYLLSPCPQYPLYYFFFLLAHGSPSDVESEHKSWGFFPQSSAMHSFLPHGFSSVHGILFPCLYTPFKWALKPQPEKSHWPNTLLPPLKNRQWPSNQENRTQSLDWRSRPFITQLLLPSSSPRAPPPKASVPIRSLTQYACIHSIH